MSWREGEKAVDRIAKAMRRISRDRYIRRGEVNKTVHALACDAKSGNTSATVKHVLQRLGFGDGSDAMVGMVRGHAIAQPGDRIYLALLRAEQEMERPRFLKAHGYLPLKDATAELTVLTYMLKELRFNGH